MTRRYFISFPKSGRSWLRYALHESRVGDQIAFHHDGFEYNDGAKPPLDFELAKRFERYDNDCLIVYMERNPLDIMVSLYHQITGRFADYFNYDGTISDFIRDPYFGARNLNEFRRLWARFCDDRPVLRVTYEDCHADFVTTLRKIIDYYGFHVSPQLVDRASDAAAFDNMRDLENRQGSDYPWLRYRNGSPKVRRGVVGGYKDELSEQDVSYLKSIFDA